MGFGSWCTLVWLKGFASIVPTAMEVGYKSLDDSCMNAATKAGLAAGVDACFRAGGGRSRGGSQTAGVREGENL